MYAVYELLPTKWVSRFFIQTATIWYEHYNSIPTDRAGQLKAYAKFQAKQRRILNAMLAELWEPEMTARSFERGWPIVYVDGWWAGWVYEDSGDPITGKRKCRYCDRKPTPEGYDACLGHVEDAASVCCGHGVEVSYTIITGEPLCQTILGLTMVTLVATYLEAIPALSAQASGSN